MADAFTTYTPGLESPAKHLDPVLPDDGADLATASRAINVAQSGFVRLTTVEGDTATVYVAAGIAFPIRARRIWSTGTTATSIVAMS